MNRIIKFRAWDKTNKQMINYIPAILFEDANPSISLTSRDCIHNSQDWEMLYADEVELMQFTGLTDKNGKDVYEGDVVEWDDTRNNDMYGGEMETLTETVTFEGGAFLPVCLIPESEYMVVGNIFENPSLINP